MSSRLTLAGDVARLARLKGTCKVACPLLGGAVGLGRGQELAEGGGVVGVETAGTALGVAGVVVTEASVDGSSATAVLLELSSAHCSRLEVEEIHSPSRGKTTRRSEHTGPGKQLGSAFFC